MNAQQRTVNTYFCPATACRGKIGCAQIRLTRYSIQTSRVTGDVICGPQDDLEQSACKYPEFEKQIYAEGFLAIEEYTVSRSVKPGHHKHDRGVDPSGVPGLTSAETATSWTARSIVTCTRFASEVKTESSHAVDKRRQALETAVRLRRLLLSGAELFSSPQLDHNPSRSDVTISIISSCFHLNAGAVLFSVGLYGFRGILKAHRMWLLQ